MTNAVTINAKIVGHELKEEREKQPDGTVFTYDMLHVKMRGVGGDGKTRVTIVREPSEREKFPLGDVCEMRFEIRQTRLDLGAVAKEAVRRVNQGELDTPDMTVRASTSQN
jgi:hypothetical protein